MTYISSRDLLGVFMDWHAYLYLAPLALVALILLLVTRQLMPGLMRASKRRTPAEVGLLLGIVVLGLAVIYGNFYLGRLSFAYSDVGSDTLQQYVPYYINLLESVRTGTLGFWNFDFGLGASLTSMQSWTNDPFNLIFIPLGLILGTNHTALALIATQSIKVVISGLLFDHILTFYCDRPISRVLGAALYAFGGYLLLWGQHYWIGSIYVVNTLLVLALELLAERWTPARFLFLAASTALPLTMSPYSGFMIMLFATAYALLRTAHLAQGGPRNALLLFGRLALPVVCGIIIAMASVLPYATFLLRETSRVGSSEDASLAAKALYYLPRHIPRGWVLPVLSRLLGNGLLSNGADIPSELIMPTEDLNYVNVYEIVMGGFSCGAFILIAQFYDWATRETSTKDKALILIATLLVAWYCLGLFLPALSNVFVEPKYRSSFALAVPFCLAIAVGWDRRIAARQVSLWALVLGAGITCAVLVWSLLHTINGRLSCLAYLAGTIVATVCLWLAHADASASDDTPRLRHANAAALNDYEPETLSVPSTCLALACAALVASSVVDGFFVTNLRQPTTPENFPLQQVSSAQQETIDALTWLHEEDPTFWRLEKTYADYTLWEDSFVLGYHGISAYNSVIDADLLRFYRYSWVYLFQGWPVLQNYNLDPDQPILTALLDVRYILSREALAYEWLEEIGQFGEVHVYRNMGDMGFATLRQAVISESAADVIEGDDARREVFASAVVVEDSAVALTGLATLDSATPQIPTGTSSAFTEAGDCLTGSISTDVASVVCLPIPHTAGWEVQVDGTRVETFCANYGFIGFTVDPGNHEVVATFRQPGLIPGAIVGGFGIIITIVLCIILAKRYRHQALAQADPSRTR